MPNYHRTHTPSPIAVRVIRPPEGVAGGGHRLDFGKSSYDTARGRRPLTFRAGPANPPIAPPPEGAFGSG